MSACMRSMGLASRLVHGQDAVSGAGCPSFKFCRANTMPMFIVHPGTGRGPEGLCRAKQQAADPRADIIHRFPVGSAEARQRGREDPVLLLVNVSAQEGQCRGKPVRPGWV